MKTSLLLFLCVLGVASCSTLVEVPPVPRAVAEIDPQVAWAEVLAKYVDEKGRVDFVGVSENPGKLLAYVNWVKRNGPNTTPDAFPTKWHKLGYYLNSYNALSMYNIIDSEIPESLGGLSKVKFFYFKKFVIDGQEMSLYAYENDVIRKMGEERVHFALNCMSAGCPRLPRKPFSMDPTLGAELATEATRFFNESRNVRVDHKEQEVHLSEILDFFTEDFLAKSPSLIHYANKYAKEKLPTQYDVEFIPYDWTVNIQPDKAKKVSKRSQLSDGENS